LFFGYVFSLKMQMSFPYNSIFVHVDQNYTISALTSSKSKGASKLQTEG